MIYKIWIKLYNNGGYKLNLYTTVLKLQKKYMIKLFVLNMTGCVEVTGWFDVKSQTKATTIFFIVEMFEKLLSFYSEWLYGQWLSRKDCFHNNSILSQLKQKREWNI